MKPVARCTRIASLGRGRHNLYALFRLQVAPVMHSTTLDRARCLFSLPLSMLTVRSVQADKQLGMPRARGVPDSLGYTCILRGIRGMRAPGSLLLGMLRGTMGARLEQQYAMDAVRLPTGVLRGVRDGVCMDGHRGSCSTRA